jgi:hypothetical protein
VIICGFKSDFVLSGKIGIIFCVIAFLFMGRVVVKAGIQKRLNMLFPKDLVPTGNRFFWI